MEDMAAEMKASSRAFDRKMADQGAHLNDLKLQLETMQRAPHGRPAQLESVGEDPFGDS